MIRSMNGNVGFQPFIESPVNERSLPGFLEENPQYVLGNGTFRKIPLLTGVTRDETANGIDIKAIEHSFTSASNFAESVVQTLFASKLVESVVRKALPGIGKKLQTFIDVNHMTVVRNWAR